MYRKDYFRSRNKEEGDYIPCECCKRRIKRGYGPIRTFPVTEIHHCVSSFRGKRKHNKDGSDLLGVCRLCHDYIHYKLGNGWEIKQELIDLARKHIGKI